jgi:Family of unknown function (DUF6289)
MTSTTSPTRKLFLLLCAIALAAGASIMAPQTAAALPAQSCLCNYYSDASYTNQVGEWDVYCNGHIVHWGSRTVYSICDCCTCPC